MYSTISKFDKFTSMYSDGASNMGSDIFRLGTPENDNVSYVFIKSNDSQNYCIDMFSSILYKSYTAMLRAFI